jgi:hypothetical protein
LITRPDVLKARIGSAFSKIPKWFTCEIIVPFVITRSALLLVGWLGFHLLPLPVAFPSAWEIGPEGNRHAVVDHISPTPHPWVNMLSRWDAAWYVEIARDGYHYEPGAPSNPAFFPLYPLLIRAVHALLLLPENDYWWLAIAIAISNVALVIGLTYFRALLAMDFGEDLISRTITYLFNFADDIFLLRRLQQIIVSGINRCGVLLRAH